jgi:hypothetical protein
MLLVEFALTLALLDVLLMLVIRLFFLCGDVVCDVMCAFRDVEVLFLLNLIRSGY